MCHKTKILTERVCFHCQNEFHLLYFRFIEKHTVYFFAKCTKCNYSYRQNCTYEKWKSYLEEDVQLKQLTIHHRRPKAKGGSDNPENLSKVPLKKHMYYHALFGTKSPIEIAEYLTKIWVDPNYKLIAVKI